MTVQNFCGSNATKLYLMFRTLHEFVESMPEKYHTAFEEFNFVKTRDNPTRGVWDRLLHNVRLVDEFSWGIKNNSFQMMNYQPVNFWSENSEIQNLHGRSQISRFEAF